MSDKNSLSLDTVKYHQVLEGLKKLQCEDAFTSSTSSGSESSSSYESNYEPETNSQRIDNIVQNSTDGASVIYRSPSLSSTASSSSGHKKRRKKKRTSEKKENAESKDHSKKKEKKHHKEYRPKKSEDSKDSKDSADSKPKKSRTKEDAQVKKENKDNKKDKKVKRLIADGKEDKQRKDSSEDRQRKNSDNKEDKQRRFSMDTTKDDKQRKLSSEKERRNSTEVKVSPSNHKKKDKESKKSPKDHHKPKRKIKSDKSDEKLSSGTNSTSSSFSLYGVQRTELPDVTSYVGDDLSMLIKRDSYETYVPSLIGIPIQCSYFFAMNSLHNYGTAEASYEKRQPPSAFLCALTGRLMEDPVISPASGITFERRAIEEHLKKEQTDPTNGQPLLISQLIPNSNLKQLLVEWTHMK